MSKDKVKNAVLLCLKIIIPISILIPLAFFTYRLIEGHLEDIANRGTEGYHSGMGLYVFASHVVLFAANAVFTIIGAIGLLIAKKFKTSPAHKKNVITFRCLALSPLGSQILYVLITIIVLNIG